MKTLAVILNFNMPELTDTLYDQLNPYRREDYDLFVLDNGSEEDKISKHTTLRLEENSFFGGALNIAFSLMLKNPEIYDSLLFLNSDLIVHGYNFVRSLRKEMFDNNLTIVSPSIIQPERNQCFWSAMHNWNSKTTRIIKWVDFQAPLIHRKLIEEVKQFDEKLKYGWGQDVLSGIICEKNNWKIGICDFIPAIHLGSKTINSNKHLPSISNYNHMAEKNMWEYFKDAELMEQFFTFRAFNQNYSYENWTMA